MPHEQGGGPPCLCRSNGAFPDDALLSVGASRDFVVNVLTEWQLTPLVEDIKLCVSELATNALLHGVPPGREFAVHLRTTEDLVRLEVRDSGGGRPAIQHAENDCCSGRGLFLVRELAAEFGIDHHVVGKTVWLTFKRPAAPFVP